MNIKFRQKFGICLFKSMFYFMYFIFHNKFQEQFFTNEKA